MFLGTYGIDEYVPIPVTTHRFSTGAAYACTSLTYSIYEEGNTTGLDEDVDMTPASPFDSITGFFYARRQLTAAAGFEAGKTYVVVVKATVDSVAAIEAHVFQIRAIQTGDSYAVVAHADYGNAKLVRSTTPANTLTVDANHLVAVPATQKVDVETVKTQAVTCAAPVAVLASVGTAATSTAQTGDSYAIVNNGTYGNSALNTKLGTPAGASVSADVAAVKSDTAATLLDTGTDGVVVAAASKTGYALSAAGIQAIWDALSSALTTVGSIGKRIVDYLDAAVSGRAAADTALSNATWTDTKAGYLDAAVSSRSTLAAGAQMDLVNAPNATAVTAIQNGLATAAALTTVDGIVDSILAAVDTEVAAIKAKTDNLPTDPADQSAVEAAITAATSPLATSAALAIVDALVDAIKAQTDLLPAAPAATGDIPTVTEIHQHLIDGTQFRILIARMAALLVGKSTGDGYVFRDVADARDAVTFVTDANNNRTSVTYDDTGA